MGHIIGKNGVRTDPSKIEQVRNWPVPASTTEVKSFLGLASYNRKFVKDFTTIAAPLHKLTAKDIRFRWSPDCEVAFAKLKAALCSSPILATPDTAPEAAPFILDTDACDFGIGAVLSQVQQGQERVISYASRCLNKHEKKYCATRKEMLALVYFVKIFRHYLLGKRFIVRTDHQALIWLQTFKEPAGQIARWQEQLQEFDFECINELV